MSKINRVVQCNPANDSVMPRLRVTGEEIAEVKRKHILQNLFYTPDEAGKVLAKSARTVLQLVKEGKLIAGDEHGKNTGKASSGIRISATSLEAYCQSILVAPMTWEE